MRNTRLFIVVGIVILIVIIVITTLLTNRLKKNTETPVNQQTEKVESGGTRTLSRTEKTKEASRITKQGNASLLNDDQVKRLNKLSSIIAAGQDNVIVGNDFDIGFSNITNLFCVQKKTPQGDVEFKNYLTEKQALDIYEKDPSLFVTSDENCTTFLKKQEEYIVQDLELDEEAFPDSENTESAIANANSKRSTDYDQIKETFSEIITSLYEIENLVSTDSSTLPISGNVNPPNLGNINSDGYYMMPQATNGEYSFGGWNACMSHSDGSKELISAIYTAALRWKAKYPQYTFRIGDLNGRKVPAYQGHQSHGDGVDVDIVTSGNWNLQINAPTEVNIDLGKAFIDTGVTNSIIFGGDADKYNPRPQLVTVTNAWRTYANSKGLPFHTYATGNHDNHFHIRINDQFRLKEYRPSSPC